MANTGFSIPVVNDAMIHLPTGFRFLPTEDELVINYLYPRALHVPLPCEIITDINILHHNPWDIVPVVETEKGKYFFTRKVVKYPSSHRRNRVAGDGFWRAAGSEVPIYYKPEGANEGVLVGMRRTLVFHNGKPRNAKRTEWAMRELRLAGAAMLPRAVMRRGTGDGSVPPRVCPEETVAQKSDGLSATVPAKFASAPLVRTIVKPDSSWLICRIYKKRQRTPRVIIPPAIGNIGVDVIPNDIANAREGHVRFIDFLGQPPHIDSSSPHSCTVDPSLLDERTDESTGCSEDKDSHGLNEGNQSIDQASKPREE
ncbi:NAC transcription factor 32-like [Oryza brachyantha]|uniref:NAC domain-containing protein n=1 Tax=Oryza brachyantha TaxID=4533 RepID=J3N8K6_ORYBR|nr:NAC transcription factor 32-like [Oryza brachyantha]